jgi:hypothetical protein
VSDASYFFPRTSEDEVRITPEGMITDAALANGPLDSTKMADTSKRVVLLDTTDPRQSPKTNADNLRSKADLKFLLL